MSADEKREQLRREVAECPGAAGLYGTGVAAALRAIGRRSPELAQVAELEAAEWSKALTPGTSEDGHHWSLDSREGEPCS